MAGRSEIPLIEFLERLRKGEDVMVEYGSKEPAHLIFLSFLESLKRLGRKFLLIDELDQLHVFRAHVKLSGLDVGAIDEAKVVKFGGILNTGNVVGRIDLTEEPPVRKKRYEEILKNLGESMDFRLMLGFDKVIRSFEGNPKEIERIFGYLIRPHLGDESRVTVYMVNRDLLRPEILNEMREHATRVLESRLSGNGLSLVVTKSIHVDEYGTGISI